MLMEVWVVSKSLLLQINLLCISHSHALLFIMYLLVLWLNHTVSRYLTFSRTGELQTLSTILHSQQLLHFHTTFPLKGMYWHLMPGLIWASLLSSDISLLLHVYLPTYFFNIFSNPFLSLFVFLLLIFENSSYILLKHLTRHGILNSFLPCCHSLFTFFGSFGWWEF